MTDPKLFAAGEATWPAAHTIHQGPWTLRDGQGGGKRVSAATAEGDVTTAQIAEAEDAMCALGQAPLFQIRPNDTALDAQLEALGYDVVDPVCLMTIPVATLAQIAPPPVSAFAMSEPLAIMREVWSDCGIGPERLAVMKRVDLPKRYVLGRSNDRAAGASFAAIHEKTVFCHALEVLPTKRRQGTARNMLRAAARWAQENGAQTFAIYVVEGNAPGRALFSSLGFTDVGHYHYRIKSSEGDRA
ncbi:GNAT family N-acetyltransferase [Actibacterium pelagium]|uniref:N-acetyltransferase n=1 Tax=Actibacterium pelagium TaxID=2029103 RepID=A0A917AHP3_9RHOB|nr:GNAT family N-acetyltransferase [Actibacterium pelagium]GGE52675.1 N-acetyltransferase [Actibacterium pelagium]